MSLTGLAAFAVLEDCRVAHSLLELEEDEVKWRVHWVGAIALIRAVGHVLKNVDTKRFPEIKTSVESAYRLWKSGDPDHAIFREFIEDERNNILKEYRSSAHPSGVIPLILESFPFAYKQNEEGNITDFELLSENLFRPRLDGYMAGQDCRDIYLEAIKWWRRELSKIASQIS